MIIISSFNIKNNFNKKNNQNKMIKDYINKYKINILGVQELTYSNSINFLLNNYNINGKGRLMKLNTIFNETNSIITDYKITNHNTIWLPWFPSTFPRIMTITYLKTYENKKICVINTHLDFLFNFVKYKELNKIYEYIYKINKNYSIILMGDFNLNINDKIFNRFIEKLNLLNISRVEFKGETLKNQKLKQIDHIFVSNDFDIIEYEIIKDKIVEKSDHYPILVKLKNRENAI